MLHRTPTHRRRGAALPDVIAVCCCLALLIPLLAAGLGGPARRGTGRLSVACMHNLQTIGAGVAMCFAENNDYGPTWDDGNTVSNMLNWTDLLYDLDYVPDDNVRICPADEHPDFPAEARATRWGFVFTDDFDSNQPPRPGVRTSYSLSAIMNFNAKEDRFEDPSRQVYAMDGWWSWFANLNAMWVYAPLFLDEQPDPVLWPTWEGTMAAWRHGVIPSANALFLDGHVARIVTRQPKNLDDLYERTVNTLRAFTWLPGERTTRFDFDPYQGSIEKYQGRRPFYLNNVGQPPDYPDHLDCNWRTRNDAWIKFPNDQD